ncbi:hypothetical protein PRIPAC_72401, partial [Pristionchus pacificus]
FQFVRSKFGHWFHSGILKLFFDEIMKNKDFVYRAEFK